MLELVNATESDINPMNTKYNRIIKKGNTESMRENFEAWQKAREEQGLKRKDKRTNMFTTGTLQISDDGLERLGWKSDKDGNKLPTDQQTEETIKRVTDAYISVCKSVNVQPKQYGKINSMALHFDEGSPHVDFTTEFLSADNPEETVRDFLHGETDKYKGDRKGKMRSMQDNLMEPYRKNFEQKNPNANFDKFLYNNGLERGERSDFKGQKSKNLRKRENELKDNIISMIEMNEPTHKVPVTTLIENPKPISEKEGKQQHKMYDEDMLLFWAQTANRNNLQRIKDKDKEAEKKLLDAKKRGFEEGYSLGYAEGYQEVQDSYEALKMIIMAKL